MSETMEHKYFLKRLTRLNAMLFGLPHALHGHQLWALCKVRKPHVCVITGQPIKKGEQAYRPITNAGNRYERIAAKVFNREVLSK